MNTKRIAYVGAVLISLASQVWAGTGYVRCDNSNTSSAVGVTVQSGKNTLTEFNIKGGQINSYDVSFSSAPRTVDVYLKKLSGGLVKSYAPSCSTLITPPFNSNTPIGMNLVIVQGMRGLGCSIVQAPHQN